MNTFITWSCNHCFNVFMGISNKVRVYTRSKCVERYIQLIFVSYICTQESFNFGASQTQLLTHIFKPNYTLSVSGLNIVLKPFFSVAFVTLILTCSQWHSQWQFVIYCVTVFRHVALMSFTNGRLHKKGRKLLFFMMVLPMLMVKHMWVMQ